MPLFKKIIIAVLSLMVLGLTLLGVLTIARGTPLETVTTFDASGKPPSVGDGLFASTMELYAATPIIPGNTVEVLNNGDETYPRIWADIRGAKRTITVQSYYSEPGRMADTLAKYLSERARSGVRVLLMLDGLGSQTMPDEWIAGLKAAGVKFAWIRPLRWYSLHKTNNRSHARLVVVDGRVGYTGGFGIADKWFGSGRSPEEWRDTNARFTGPAVMQLQGAFAAAWAEATGELLVGDVFFPDDRFLPTGVTDAGLLYAVPTTGSSNMERFLALSIASARRRLYVSNSYFVPDDDFRRLLTGAAKRGVDVRILTAGDQTDVKTTMYAGRKRYEELLEGGVRVYEYLPTMTHSKTFVIDGLWSTVGSANFDNRSLAFNNETNLMILDEGVGAKMDSVFLADLAFAKEIDLATFRKRGVGNRIMEWGAHMMSRML